METTNHQMDQAHQSRGSIFKSKGYITFILLILLFGLFAIGELTYREHQEKEYEKNLKVQISQTRDVMIQKYPIGSTVLVGELKIPAVVVDYIINAPFIKKYRDVPRVIELTTYIQVMIDGKKIDVPIEALRQ